ncbi:NUDIX domain-containing protein [Streptomyces bobili]|uniref:nucleotide triphosphate diphosphatase NUDT15 n=1 Tax=Streptomyces bobili TaxID=67280 RepID=UPI0033AD8A19
MTGAGGKFRAPVVGVGAILVRSDGAVLIGHRIKRGERPSWCLPGGHVEAGETFESAALREIAEESGIREVTGPRVFAVALRTDTDRTQVTAGVVACTADVDEEPDTPEPEVFDRWVWARPENLPLPLFPASAALLAAWQGRPVPEGWTVYAASDAMAGGGGGR